jgi:hypothetical protein
MIVASDRPRTPLDGSSWALPCSLSEPDCYAGEEMSGFNHHKTIADRKKARSSLPLASINRFCHQPPATAATHNGGPSMVQEKTATGRTGAV